MWTCCSESIHSWFTNVCAPNTRAV